MIYELTDTAPAASLFADWEETMIASCLQGIMGTIYSDSPVSPSAAMAALGDFAFLAGTPDPELAAYRPAWHTGGFRLLIPQNPQWEALIRRIYGPRARFFSRYATKKEPGVFDRVLLRKAVSSLPEGYTLSRIDEPLYRLCKGEAWSRDLVSQFSDYGHFRRLGLGFVIHEGSLLLSGASSYSRCREGIEIEVDTRESHRRRGLARACAARLILECLDRGLYPSWDAHNEASLSLARSLGYHLSHAYTAVEVWDL